MDSIWSKTSKGKKRPSLEGDIRTDVAVIGGGMTGVLTAWQLQQAGIHTVILEADQIGGDRQKNYRKDHIPAWNVLSQISGEKRRRKSQKLCTGQSGSFPAV